MAITESEHTCMSCPYKTEWLLHALSHVNATNHTMNMSGTIRPGTPSKFCPPVGSSRPRSASTQSSAQTVVDPVFEELRKKLISMGVKGV